MKTLSTLITALALSIFVAACSSASKDEKTQLDELKKKQAELGQKIKTLEGKVQASDTSRTTKTKEVVASEVKPTSFD
jgi:outer membrane murein-binding lipoprotein Lpp